LKCTPIQATNLNRNSLTLKNIVEERNKKHFIFIEEAGPELVKVNRGPYKNTTLAITVRI
jgi:hypothetical protein